MDHDTESETMPAVTTTPSAYEVLYLVLAGLFVAALVTCNLIFKKFFSWDVPVLGYTFEQSVGLLPCPATFLVTDILSEVYGKKRADTVVLSGLAASVFVVAIVSVAGVAPAAAWSKVQNEDFNGVFGLAWVAVSASMVAYLVAQLLDVRLFHFWKRLTKGKHLWLRNNASTVCSQVVDTVLVLGLLVVMKGGVTWEQFPRLCLNGILFKMLCALFDTPLFYAATAWFRQRFPEETAAVYRESGGIPHWTAPRGL